MPDLDALKQRVCAAVDRRAAELIETADWIHAHPEIGHQEVQAAIRLADLLRAAGADVEMGTAGMATAFKAELPGGSRSAARGHPGRVRRAAEARATAAATT